MADIRDKTEQIRQAVYGKDVRESIASGIDAISDQQDSYENDLTMRQNTYEQNIIDRQNTYEGIITDQQNIYEQNIRDRQSAYENQITDRQNTYEQNITGRQDGLETRQTNIENTFRQEIENNISQNPSSAETVYARTDRVNNVTYHNLGERLDDIISKLGFIPIDGGSFFETYIEFEKDGGTF